MEDLNQELMIAAKANNLETVKRVLKSGADVHVYEDYTLRWASSDGFIKIVKCLIENGANAQARRGEAIQWAAAHNHAAVVNYLENI